MDTSYGITNVLVPPTVEPVTLSEAKAWLKADSGVTDEDDAISGLIVAAREHCESVLGHALLEQTQEYVLDDFPRGLSYIELPRAIPLQSVTHVKYKDSDAVITTWATTEYLVDTDSRPGRVVLAYNKSWPTFTRYPAGAVRVTYVCGVKNTSPTVSFSDKLRLAMKVFVTDAYFNRGDGLDGTGRAGIGIGQEARDRIERLLASHPTRQFSC